MPEIKILADNIKEIRRTLNESQIEFAAHCGISTEILSLLEREKSDPKLSTLQKIAAYTNCTVAELLYSHKKDSSTDLGMLVARSFFFSSKQSF